jgi:hypothetical protein
VPPRVTHILTKLIVDADYDPRLDHFGPRIPFST